MACARVGLSSEKLQTALIGPLAHKSPAGFLFLCASFARSRSAEETKEGRAMLQIAFEKSGGLVPAIIQDDRTGDVLMLGFMNAEALAETQRTREVVFFSRSRNKLWKKGETSGHVLRVRDLLVDCDADAILVRVDALGPGVCHEGYRSCFFRRLSPAGEAEIAETQTFAPEKVYGREKQS
jgi:phosphoribosyl-AMP cyclohydrolase